MYARIFLFLHFPLFQILFTLDYESTHLFMRLDLSLLALLFKMPNHGFLRVQILL